MSKTLAVTAAAMAILFAVPVVAAYAGGASSAPSKYSYQTVSSSQARDHRLVQNADLRITEFSSSSAKIPVGKR